MESTDVKAPYCKAVIGKAVAARLRGCDACVIFGCPVDVANSMKSTLTLDNPAMTLPLIDRCSYCTSILRSDLSHFHVYLSLPIDYSYKDLCAHGLLSDLIPHLSQSKQTFPSHIQYGQVTNSNPPASKLRRWTAVICERKPRRRAFEQHSIKQPVPQNAASDPG